MRLSLEFCLTLGSIKIKVAYRPTVINALRTCAEGLNEYLIMTENFVQQHLVVDEVVDDIQEEKEETKDVVIEEAKTMREPVLDLDDIL